MASEKTLQAYIAKNLRAKGALVYKFTSPSCAGVPDLLVLPPGAPAFFIEVKSPTGKGRLSKLQEYTQRELQQRGHRCYVIASQDDYHAHFDASTGGRD